MKIRKVGNIKTPAPNYTLFLSNCYGEDRSAALIATELKKLNPKMQLLGAPLISKGEEYTKRNINLLIKGKVPPSGGFPRNFISFLIDTLTCFYIPIRYWLLLKRNRQKILSAIVVGDVFLLILAYLGLKKRLLFLAPAKSNYQNPHSKWEEWLMRKCAIKVFTHDEFTAQCLRQNAVDAEFLGNPMMDELEKITNYQLPITNYQYLIGILPGSRKEAYKNFLKILKPAEQLAKRQNNLAFVSAIPTTLDIQKLVNLPEKIGWKYETAKLSKNTISISILQNPFGDVINNADIVIGLAGTANEQAAGLGKPIISFQGTGPQTSKKRIIGQEKLLGNCLKFVSDYPEGVVREILKLLKDDQLRKQRGDIGKKRMGLPGGAKRIAGFILKKLKNAS